MASRGSVIPLFIDQIKQGRPLTITDPLMTRFLMSLDDAVDLVLYAFQYGQQGDIFVPKAPASNIQDLAIAIKKLLNAANEVKIIGTRHGEKLHETLLTREEFAHAQDLGKYYRVPADNRDLNYNNYFVSGKVEVSQAQDYNSSNTTQLSVPKIVELLKNLPEILDDIKNVMKNGKVHP